MAVAFGKYQLLKRIASGGMGQVFLARFSGAQGFEKLLVIKRLLPHLAEDEDFLLMFMDEARIAARLNHPNIAQIFEMGEVSGSRYVAMEYVAGEDLRALRGRGADGANPLPLGVACRIIADAAAALDHAHNAIGPEGEPLGVVHRDVSPPNILVGFDGGVKLIDFGVARAVGRLQHTNAKILKGKYPYMSPEQISGLSVNGRSDVFSLGILFWELLSARRLFRGDSELETLQRVHKCDVPRLETVAPTVPAELSDIVMRVLAREPEDRFQNAGDFRMAIEDFLVLHQLPASSAHLKTFVSQLFSTRIAKEKELTRFEDVTPASIFEMGYGTPPPPSVGTSAPTKALTPPAPPQQEIPIELEVTGEGVAKPHKERHFGLWVTAAALLVCLLGGGLAWWGFQDEPDFYPGVETAAVATLPAVSPVKMDERPVAPEGPTESGSGLTTRGLHLSSQPPGATVIVDGKSVGATPLEYPLPSGEPVIATFVLAGFEKRKEPLTASSGPEVHVQLKRRAAVTRRPSRLPGPREPMERPLEIKTGR